jgi:hexosaminidase
VRCLRACAVRLAVVLAGTAAAVPPAEAARPLTIPALREWTDVAGSYTFGPGSRIVLNSSHAAALATSASVFADDLYQMTGTSVAVVAGTPATGDIYLTLGSADTALGDEGYRLTIGASVRIESRADPGAFNGTRTVLRLLKQGSTIAAGTARDWPMYRLWTTGASTSRRPGCATTSASFPT